MCESAVTRVSRGEMPPLVFETVVVRSAESFQKGESSAFSQPK